MRYRSGPENQGSSPDRDITRETRLLTWSAASCSPVRFSSFFIQHTVTHSPNPAPYLSVSVCVRVCVQMDEIKLKDRAVSVLDKALGLQAGHAHRLQLQTQAAEQQIAALRDAQRAGLNHPGQALNSTPNTTPHIVSPASSCSCCMRNLADKPMSYTLCTAWSPNQQTGHTGFPHTSKCWWRIFITNAHHHHLIYFFTIIFSRLYIFCGFCLNSAENNSRRRRRRKVDHHSLFLYLTLTQ